MRVKKIFCALATVMILLASTICSAADESANAKLAKIEIDTYGMEQSGALLDRISRLEKDFSGRNMTGNMNARLEAIIDILYNNETGPGILAKINALEWNAGHEVKSGGINERISALEREILGKTTEGTFNNRIRALAKASYGEEILPIAQVQVPEGTLIKVETTLPVSSKTLQEGDLIPVRVVEDVFVDGSLVFVKGLPGEGTVRRVIRAKNIFRNGKIETDFHTLKAIDGQSVEIFTGAEAFAAMNENEMARGLSLVGQTFSGKNKDLEEVLVRGKNIDLPAGVVLYVQIETPIVVYGVRSQSGGLLLDDEQINSKPVTPTEPDESDKPEPIVTEPNPEPDDNKPAPIVAEPKPTENPDNDPLSGYSEDGEIIEIIDEE